VKPIAYKPKDWELVWGQIVKDQGASINISFVCRRKLGFTVRRHQAWVEEKEDNVHIRYGYYRETIYLDFYNESMRTLFLLKYS
jgi:hypothetical protein